MRRDFLVKPRKKAIKNLNFCLSQKQKLVKAMFRLQNFRRGFHSQKFSKSDNFTVVVLQRTARK